MRAKAAMLAGAAVLAGLAGATLGAQAADKDKGESRSAIVQKLVDCRKITDGAQRLACYDAATEAFDQAEQKGDVVVVDREEARKVRKQAFGFTLPSISIFEKGEKQEDIDTTDGVVADARHDGGGHWVIKLEDGAVWAQVGVEELFKAPRPGSKVRIKKATLGSYMMMIDNNAGFKAHRVQ